MSIKIKDVIKYTNGKLIIGDEEKECKDFIEDTRRIQNEDTYIGLKWDKGDGNIYWKEALDKGAETVIINKIDISEDELEKYKGKNIIFVEDTRVALKQMATEKRKLYKDLIVVGVTGSVGKTSTKDMIASVLSQKYKTLKTKANNNNDIGLPFTILRLEDHEAAVVEMGMSHLGEISGLTKITKPTLSVITNVGTSHIGNLGSRENILKAKLEILDGMNEKKLVINNDNDLLNLWNSKNSDIEVNTFGMQNLSDCMPTEINKKENSSEFICNIKDKKIKINVPVGGDVFILNALCAALIGEKLGLSEDEISKGIATFELTKKRMEIINLKNNITLINDAYNASYDSMKAAVEYLANSSGKRKIAVFGDMFELGEFSEELHRKVGKEISKNKIDLLFLIGEDAKYIKEEAINNKFDEKDIFYLKTRDELLEVLKKIILPRDIILFKASHGMKLFEFVDNLIEVE